MLDSREAPMPPEDALLLLQASVCDSFAFLTKGEKRWFGFCRALPCGTRPAAPEDGNARFVKGTPMAVRNLDFGIGQPRCEG